jgi:alkanesulfonate monooxygenase SsuD/methylene tetrahydromethanopterin reductase-like flavin-dependent oxidoreductase (luciferase family)
VSINSHGFIADSSQKAAEEFYPGMQVLMSRLARERGWPPVTSEQFEAGRTPRGHLLVGSPQEVIDKMLYEHSVFQYDRFLIEFSVGSIPHASMLRSIELYGTKVAPAVRKATESGDTNAREQAKGSAREKSAQAPAQQASPGASL